MSSTRPTTQHTKIIKDLDHKKLLHVIHKQFRERDRQKKHRAEETKRRLVDSLAKQQPANTTTSSMSMDTTFDMDRSQSTPEFQTVHSVIDEIKYHNKTKRRRRMTQTQNNFNSVLETARRQVAMVPFSPLRHKKIWLRTGLAHMPPEQQTRDPRDVSNHYVGEFGDQWFEREKKGLQQFLTSPTKRRTRMTRDEFFEACEISSQEQSKNRETIKTDVETIKASWVDPAADGRLQVYDMLVSSDGSTSCVIKRKAWKLLRSNKNARPILDACPLLAPLAGKPNPRWSGATGHDKPLPFPKVLCNMESKLPMKFMKSCRTRVLRELDRRPSLGITLRQRALRQEGLSALDFYNTEIKKLRRETPSVLRKAQHDMEVRRLADLEHRKAKKIAKREESRRQQAEKAEKQALLLNSMRSRPGTALSELSPELQREEAAKILQRIGLGFLGRKRCENKKEKMMAEVESN
jgi:hypothetical protein